MKKSPTKKTIVGEIIEKTEFKYNVNNIPKTAIEELARCFLPDILAFFESEDRKQEYENWKNNNNLS